MNKHPLIGIILCAVVLLILGSFSNAIGYQTRNTPEENTFPPYTIQNSNINNSSVSSSIIGTPTDWWPMFHHDPQLTGFSSSTAPSTNKVLWRVGDWAYDVWDDPMTSSPAIVNDKLYIGAIDCEYPKTVSPLNDTAIQNPYFYYMNPLHRDIIHKNGEAPLLWEGVAYCIDTETGEEEWKTYLTEDQFSIWASPALYNDMVFISTFNNDFDTPIGHLFCLDALNGEILWNLSIVQKYSSPLINNGKLYIVAMERNTNDSFDCLLYCLNATTGSTLFESRVGEGEPVETPSLYQNQIYISVFDRTMKSNSLYCVSAQDGEHQWQSVLGQYPGSSPVISNDRVVVSSTFWDGAEEESGILWCFNATTGIALWNYSLDSGSNQYSTPAIAYDKIYITSTHYLYGCGKVECLELDTGNLLWNTSLGKWLFCSPAVADNKLYISSFTNSMDPMVDHDGEVFCIDADTGDILWRYWLSLGTLSSPSVTEGRLYIASPFFIHAFDDTSPVNTPPTTTITGPLIGFPGREYNYSFIVNDPDGDMAFLFVQLSDDPGTWIIGPCQSGNPIVLTRSWEQGTFFIRALAQDAYYAYGNWTVFTVNISEPTQIFLFGLVRHVIKENEYTLMNVTGVFSVQFSPLKIQFISSGKQIMILNGSNGFVGSHIICGKFQAIIG